MPQFFRKDSPEKKESRLIINYPKVLTTFLMALAITGVVGYLGFTAYKAVIQLAKAAPAISFAYQYPELVDPLRDQYTTEWSALKDSMIKRQAFISPLPEGEDLGKELSQE